VNGVIVKKWIYSGQLSPIAELDSANNVVARFVGSMMIKDGNSYQLITDHLGSVRIVVDVNTGDVFQKIDYDEFGNVLSNSNPDFQPFNYAGGLYDTQTKLVRFGVRDYEARVGRWTNKDPIGFHGGQANVFAYVLNNPINLSDLSGLKEYIVVTAALTGGIAFWGAETGKIYAIDPSTGNAFTYWYIGEGLGAYVDLPVPVTGAVTVEAGVWNLDSPSSPLGIGWQLGGFIAAGKGGSGNISGNFWNFFGGSGGVAGGVGANGGFLITGTYYTGMKEFSNLPQKIKDAINEFLKKNLCK